VILLGVLRCPAFTRAVPSALGAAVGPTLGSCPRDHLAARAGVPVHVVAARLGHADPSITLRVYAHVISEQLAEAAVIFARAVGSV
jgi:integrase